MAEDEKTGSPVTVLECTLADRDRFLAEHLGTADPGTIVRVTGAGQEYVRTQQYAWATVAR